MQTDAWIQTDYRKDTKTDRRGTQVSRPIADRYGGLHINYYGFWEIKTLNSRPAISLQFLDQWSTVNHERGLLTENK